MQPWTPRLERLPGPPPGPDPHGAWAELEPPGATLLELAARLRLPPGPARLPLWARVDRWERAGRLQRTLRADGAIAAARVLVTPWFQPVRLPSPPEGGLRLSRFAWLTQEGGAWLLRSPRLAAAFRFPDERGPALLSRYLGPAPGPPPTPLEGLAQALEAMLLEAGFLLAVGGDGLTEEDHSPALRQWELPDLILHQHSRRSRAAQPQGGTRRFQGILPPTPLERPAEGSEPAPLPPPAETLDMPLGEALSLRRSRREPGRAPLEAASLSTLLFHTLRLDRGRPEAGLAWGPVPSGGALHPLEVYLAVRRCPGLDAGLYRYRRLAHRLDRLQAPPEAVERLLGAPSQGAGASPPGVLMILAARFQRTSWKYQGLAYSLILKEAGCALQALYLGAEALGLAACAVGTGDSEAFARATGLDPAVEGPVAELTLR